MSNNILKGKKGIIFGALNEQSIAWKVAERAHEHAWLVVAFEFKIKTRKSRIVFFILFKRRND